MKNILFITNFKSPSQKGKPITSFSKAAFDASLACNLKFHINTNNLEIISQNDDENVNLHIVEVYRNPFSLDVFRGYRQLVKVIKENKIDYIHCNTPVGGLIARLAGKKCKVKKVIYQAHGFHFYKGAPKKNWLIYYPVEKWLSRYTDAIITINKEDFELAKSKFKLRRGGKVYYVPGVGMDISLYNQEIELRNSKRDEMGLTENDIALISMGDLIERKNYKASIEAIALAKNPALQYFICGKGPEEDNLKLLAENLGVSSQVHFLGFRSDIKELLCACDIFLFTTKQEGLPRSMMEAMASGLPCVASNIRGNTDLLEGADGGFLCDVMDVADYADKLLVLANDAEMRSNMGKNNLSTIKKFSIETVTGQLRKIYESEFDI